MKTYVYGIKNCDTMKKAFDWLDRNGIDYVFHDYKKSGADMDALSRAVKAHGWENVINRKGTTWRGLPDETRENMNEKTALKAAAENPSLIRRPLIVHGASIHFGYDETAYGKLFKK